MGLALSYKGNLKQPDNLKDLFAAATEFANVHGWHCSTFERELHINVPDCEPFLLRPQDGKIHGWIKFWCDDETLEQLFELLRAIKPYFKRLNVDDDVGAWHNYIARFSKEKLPVFRELKDIEREELANWFYLPKGSTTIFGMEQIKAVLMFMVCKDLSDDLTKPMTKDILLEMIDDRVGRWPDDDVFNFMHIVETWFITKLNDKKGNSIKVKTGNTDGSRLFAWFMTEIIIGFWGGSLGSKHQRLNRFVDSLQKQGIVSRIDSLSISFDTSANFLRFVYSTMEYCGGFRSENLITRCQ